MKLESQVVSLELAKKLKELGVKQESLFSWILTDEDKIELSCNSKGYCTVGRYIRVPNYGEPEDYGYREIVEQFSAFTVAELGEMLPWCVKNEKEREINTFKTGKNAYGEWICEYHRSFSQPLHRVIEKTEADARAKMLIYLIENGLTNTQ